MTDTLPNIHAMNVEWERWQAVVSLLRETKAVTEDDCRAPVYTDDPGTIGQQLFEAIRQWGEALVTLRGGKPAA